MVFLGTAASNREEQKCWAVSDIWPIRVLVGIVACKTQRTGWMPLNSCTRMQIASVEKQLYRTYWAAWNPVAVKQREVLNMPSIHSHPWVAWNLGVKFCDEKSYLVWMICIALQGRLKVYSSIYFNWGCQEFRGLNVRVQKIHRISAKICHSVKNSCWLFKGKFYPQIVTCCF